MQKVDLPWSSCFSLESSRNDSFDQLPDISGKRVTAREQIDLLFVLGQNVGPHLPHLTQGLREDHADKLAVRLAHAQLEDAVEYFTLAEQTSVFEEIEVHARNGKLLFEPQKVIR